MERPKVGVGVFVLKNNKILVGKRINSHGNETWSLPGGHLELFETFEECAKREVLEESGLHIKSVEFLTATNDIFNKEKKHYITIFMLSKYAKGTLDVKEKDKCEKWIWCEWENIPEPLFLPLENLKKKNINLKKILKEKN